MMTRLEGKLHELGYKVDKNKNVLCYTKTSICWVEIYMFYSPNIDKIIYFELEPYMPINNKKDLRFIIKALKKAYKVMEMDLKVLKEMCKDG